MTLQLAIVLILACGNACSAADDGLETRAGSSKTQEHVKSNQQQLSAQVEWNESGIGEAFLPVPLFSETVEFSFFPAEGAPEEVTTKMADTVNDVLALDASALTAIRELLWEECRFNFQVADYGVTQHAGESSLDAHLREFGVASADDAMRKAELRSIHIQDGWPSRYAELKYYTVSEQLVSIIIKNGKVIDYDDDGTHLGWFKDDERHAHRKREQTLAKP